MARIRSLHPGQWRDADFCDCSALARLLALALRNIADDNGVFEWKPAEIKIECLPADNVEVKKLLAELVQRGLVKRFEVDRRAYGAIRNFLTWQRPQKPKPVHPCPDDIVPFLRKNTNTQAFSYDPLPDRVNPKTGEIVTDTRSLQERHHPEAKQLSSGTVKGNQEIQTEKRNGEIGEKEAPRTSPVSHSATGFSEELTNLQKMWPTDRKRGLDVNVWTFRVLAGADDSLARQELVALILVAAAEHVAGWAAIGTERRHVPALSAWLEGKRWLESPESKGAKVSKATIPVARTVSLARFARNGGSWPASAGDRPEAAEVAEALRAWRTFVHEFAAGRISWDAATYGDRRPDSAEIDTAALDALGDPPAVLRR
jgi:hypothetical protein